MSAHHSMTIEWDGGFYGPTYSPECSAPPEAICRARWDCGCESWDDYGVDESGPWHLAYDSETDAETRHYGTAGGECGHLLFIGDDCVAELGGGSITFPIDLSWDGDGYRWSVTAEGGAK